jgi:uncharacterized protein (DUF983 family)
MLACKCPRCRIGKIFYGSPYSLKRQRTNQICPHCGLYFEIEPGYFYISMYISYAFTVIEVLIAAFILYFLVESESPWFYCSVLIPLIIVLSPINYRYSRVVLLHLFSPSIRYDPTYRTDN